MVKLKTIKAPKLRGFNFYTSIELNYNSKYIKHDDVQTLLQSLQTDSICSDRVLNAFRANIVIELDINKKSFLNISNDLKTINEDVLFAKFIELSKPFVHYINTNSQRFFPELKLSAPLELEDDFMDKMTVQKNKLIYRTNLYNWGFIGTEENILNYIESFIDNKLTDNFVLVNHFHSWGYYILNECYQYIDKKQPKQRLKDFIEHRRNSLK